MSELHPMEPEPEPCVSLAPGPPRVLTPPPGTSPPLVSSIPDILLLGSPLVGHPFPYLSTTSLQEKWGHSPNGSPDSLKLRGSELPLLELRWEVSIPPYGVMTICST